MGLAEKEQTTYDHPSDSTSARDDAGKYDATYEHGDAESLSSSGENGYQLKRSLKARHLAVSAYMQREKREMSATVY